MARFDAALAALPRLRRYAYCLYGSYAVGDALIERCLQQSANEIGRCDEADAAKHLFHLFHRCEIAGAPLVAEMAKEHDWTIPIHAAMMRLTADERRALGLTVVSGFSRHEAAEILDVSVRTFSTRLLAAKRRLCAMMPRAIIIEDEYLLASHLMDLAEDIGVTVCGTAADRQTADALARQFQPNLVLADVWLGESENGAEIAEEIQKRYDSAIVYVTAFPDRVLALPSHSPFILSKPVFSADLAQMITRACDARLQHDMVH